MSDRQIDMKICKMMNWTYQRGWAFETTGDKLNVTGELIKTREKIKTKLCMMCDKPIGDYEWKEVAICARFGQMMFEHKDCSEVSE